MVSLQVADKEAGVDCKRILKRATSGKNASAALKHRFQEGSIDEISFLGVPSLPSQAATSTSTGKYKHYISSCLMK